MSPGISTRSSGQRKWDAKTVKVATPSSQREAEAPANDSPKRTTL